MRNLLDGKQKRGIRALRLALQANKSEREMYPKSKANKSEREMYSKANTIKREMYSKAHKNQKRK